MPIGQDLTLSFDLYIIRSWDGNQLANGPDYFHLVVKKTRGGGALNPTITGSYDPPCPLFHFQKNKIPNLYDSGQYQNQPGQDEDVGDGAPFGFFPVQDDYDLRKHH